MAAHLRLLPLPLLAVSVVVVGVVVLPSRHTPDLIRLLLLVLVLALVRLLLLTIGDSSCRFSPAPVAVLRALQSSCPPRHESQLKQRGYGSLSSFGVLFWDRYSGMDESSPAMRTEAGLRRVLVVAYDFGQYQELGAVQTWI